MNNSIRSRLFLSIIFLVLFFTIILWVPNTIYLQQYYIYTKKNTLIENAKKITNVYTGNPNDIEDELDRTANITGSNIDIRDKDGRTIYKSSRRLADEKNLIDDNKSKFDMKPPPDLDFGGDKLEEYKEGEYIFETRQDIQLKINFLTLVTKLSNGDILAIRVPLVSISESVYIANKFITITGIVVVILGSIWAYLFSKKFTKPILEVNNIATNMAKFDFSQKCKITGKDEIGQLAQSINYLSGELDRTITELNVKNKKLEDDIQKERQIDKMRKEFISSVSHELRTPLSLIQGYAEGLASNITESEDDKNFYCDVIMKEADKMNKLVKDLLNLSQIESGYYHIEKIEFNLTSLTEYVLNKYKSTFSENNIQLQIELDENCIVYGDMTRIEQIMVNYINNAINHIDSSRIIKISKIDYKDKVRINVFNTGKHIPKKSLEQIWNSFYKVDKARSRAYGGYGLGLSIVKAIAELHNSFYGVENVDDGVNFWFEVNKVNFN